MLLTPTSIGARVGPGCPEPILWSSLTEPVAAVTSLAFVVAAAAIPVSVIAAERSARVLPDPNAGPRRVLGYSLLVGAIGVGSLVQHGPAPAWADVAHDVPLVATVLFVGADAVADLLRSKRQWWWWAAPTLALVPIVLAAPLAGDLAQAVAAAGAVALTLVRGRKRLRLRGRIATAVALLAIGGTVGTLSRAGWPLCSPGSIWQGHAAWHVLAAAALLVLAPVIGRGEPAEPVNGDGLRPPVIAPAEVGGQNRRGGRS
jgi:hypothetical protein